jgi:predicted MPP superfamily phosphohydrolase
MTPDETTALSALEPRLGRLYLSQRLGLERDLEALRFDRSALLFHLKRWYRAPAVIHACVTLVGLRARGRQNARAIEVRTHEVVLPHLPEAFDGLTLLHLTDLHLDIDETFADLLAERLKPLAFDLCVLTGDYRFHTFGPFQPTLDGLERLSAVMSRPAYAVLGNHDSIRMVPAMERMGVRVLLNEWLPIERGGESIYLAGIDDANLYRMENFHRAADGIPPGAVSILLSHTPETYRHAAHAGFDLVLCGHTHGGQICLPGGVPILTGSRTPRRFARGSWRYHDMVGYTSVGAGCCVLDVRLNCPPEVTLHRLRRGAPQR